MKNNENNGGNIVDAAMNAMNAATKSGDNLQKQYVTAALDALNTLLTSDITPRLASKIARFKVVLNDYAKTVAKSDATQTKIEFDAVGGATDADGNEINDLVTV